jgi:aromatic ring-opening dioxygenase catalytic subunit (LigB family)
MQFRAAIRSSGVSRVTTSSSHSYPAWPSLAPLRGEGVLIVGSGMSYHNMQTLMANMRGNARSHAPDAGSQRFDGE